jgi:hypothetical protein
MERSRQQYHSYTLRLSRITGTDTWRVTLYCAQNGERHHFRDLAELYAFLERTTSSADAEPGASEAPPEP